MEIFQSGGKTAADDGFRNVVPALAHARGHPRNGGFRVGQAEEKQADPITRRLPLPDPLQIALAGERGLEGEALAAPGAARDLLQHQAPGPNGGAFRSEGGQPGGNQIGVDEARQMGFGGKKGACKGGFYPRRWGRR